MCYLSAKIIRILTFRYLLSLVQLNERLISIIYQHESIDIVHVGLVVHNRFCVLALSEITRVILGRKDNGRDGSCSTGHGEAVGTGETLHD